MVLSLWYGIRLYWSMRPLPSGLVLVKIFYVDGAFYFIAITGNFYGLGCWSVVLMNPTAFSVANIIVSLYAPVCTRFLKTLNQFGSLSSRPITAEYSKCTISLFQRRFQVYSLPKQPASRPSQHSIDENDPPSPRGCTHANTKCFMPQQNWRVP